MCNHLFPLASRSYDPLTPKQCRNSVPILVEGDTLLFFFNLLIIVLMNIIQEKSLSQNHCLNVFLYWLNETHLILLASILSPSLIVSFHLFFLTCSSLSSLHPFRVCHRGLISSSRLQLSYSLSAHTFNVMIFSSQ